MTVNQALKLAELVRKVGPETPAHEALVTLAAAYIELLNQREPKLDKPLPSDAECAARVARAIRQKGIVVGASRAFAAATKRTKR